MIISSIINFCLVFNVLICCSLISNTKITVDAVRCTTASSTDRWSVDRNEKSVKVIISHVWRADDLALIKQITFMYEPWFTDVIYCTEYRGRHEWKAAEEQITHELKKRDYVTTNVVVDGCDVALAAKVANSYHRNTSKTIDLLVVLQASMRSPPLRTNCDQLMVDGIVEIKKGFSKHSICHDGSKKIEKFVCRDPCLISHDNRLCWSKNWLLNVYVAAMVRDYSQFCDTMSDQEDPQPSYTGSIAIDNGPVAIPIKSMSISAKKYILA